MVSFLGFLLIYTVGGLTFIPLVLALFFCHAYITFPVHDASRTARPSVDLSKQAGTSNHKEKDKEPLGIPEELKPKPHEPDVAAGYFAVCREYVPGGVNGKPPERTTPAGDVVATESPSVYQSMYRSIFDRNKTQPPQLEGAKSPGKILRKARNVFYVVLRFAIP